MKYLFGDKVDDAHKHPMETEDDHGADGDIECDFGLESIRTTSQMDDGNDGKEANYEVEYDMNDKMVLFDVPIKENKTQ